MTSSYYYEYLSSHAVIVLEKNKHVKSIRQCILYRCEQRDLFQ